MKPIHPLHGLVAATHTPFHADGSLNLSAVERQAAHLSANGIKTIFVAGTTGECSSLCLQERLAFVQRWSEVIRGAGIRMVVHVGSNCLADSRTMATQAQQLGAVAIAAMAPSYFKPGSLEALIACCAEIASAAPEIPFYFYDIPGFTGVHLSMPDFLAQAPDRVPTLAGMKFTNPDLFAYQFCLRADNGTWDIPWGLDEFFLGALALGAKGAVGSGFNFAGPIYTRLLKSFERGDIASAREEQFRGARLVKLLASYGYMGAAKALMKMLGVDVGPARLPNIRLTPEQETRLRADLDALGFFQWLS